MEIETEQKQQEHDADVANGLNRRSVLDQPEPVRAEYEAFAGILDKAEVPGLGGLPDVPTVVLTVMRPVEAPRWVGETPEGMQAKHDLHKALVDEASNATHVVTETSGSYIHREEPERVVEAIQHVLGALREQ